MMFPHMRTSNQEPSATGSGAKDAEFGDGRVPTEMDLGIQDLPERVPENALNFVVRRGRERAPRPGGKSQGGREGARGEREKGREGGRGGRGEGQEGVRFFAFS